MFFRRDVPVQFQLAEDPVAAHVIPENASNVTQLQKAPPNAQGALNCRQTLKPASDLFVLFSQDSSVTITRLTNL